jgi:glycine cleavage system H protein
MEFVMSLLPENLKYALSHEWASAEAQHIVRVGITDFAQEELGDLVYVELPDVGRRVDANESCATVESVKTASDIASPVSGEIVDINTAVVDDPEKINDDPYGAWLFCVKADDMSQLEQLLTSDAYQKMITG